MGGPTTNPSLGLQLAEMTLDSARFVLPRSPARAAALNVESDRSRSISLAFTPTFTDVYSDILTPCLRLVLAERLTDDIQHVLDEGRRVDLRLA